MIKDNLLPIVLAAFALFMVFLYLTSSKTNKLIDINLKNQQKIEILAKQRDSLLFENAQLAIERAKIDGLEHEIKIFYDSAYVADDTPTHVKDSVLSNFLRQYDSLVGNRLHQDR